VTRIWLLALLLGLCSAAVAAPLLPRDQPEQRLLKAVDRWRAGHLQRAARELRALVGSQPNFRLAQLLYADLLAARSGHRGLGPPARAQQALADLRQELQLRLRELAAPPPPGTLPSAVLELAPDVRSLIVVDLPHDRLYVLERHHQSMRLVRSYYASIARRGFGKQSSGDLRTPVGIYHITGYKPGDTLPDLYGSGAFPTSYPNAWDRHLGRTGYGIWLHGVPRNTYVRPPRTSEGCVVLANDDLAALRAVIRPQRTPVLLLSSLHWVKPATQTAPRKQLSARVDAWWQARAAGKTSGYLAFYAPAAQQAALERFSDTVSGKSGKPPAASLRNLSLFRYPGVPDLVLAQFEEVRKTGGQPIRRSQYWQRDTHGHWHIVVESNG
jgi:Uncharacterized protein conserved in bacteria